MQELLFVYKNGEAVALRPKPFCFELAMEGYIADNPQILSNYQLDLSLAPGQRATTVRARI